MDIENLIKEFDLAWKSVDTPGVVAFMNGVVGLSDEVRAALCPKLIEVNQRKGKELNQSIPEKELIIASEFGAIWKSVDQPGVSNFLCRFPELPQHSRRILFHRLREIERLKCEEYGYETPTSEHYLAVATTWISPLPTPKMFGEYQVELLISETYEAIVYKAKSHRGTQTVAIKTVDPESSPDRISRFKKECEIHRSSSPGPYILHVLHADMDHAPPYLVLEFIEGSHTLKDLINGTTNFDPKRCISRFREAVEAVEYLHTRENRLAHLDIKPNNILIQSYGTKIECAKITDFGLSRDQSLVDLGCGTPEYMAPEIRAGETYKTRPADIWSLGVVLYECLTGKLPRAKGKLRLDDIAIKEAVEPLYPKSGRGLSLLIIEALNLDPDRCLDAKTFVQKLNDIESMIADDRGAFPRSPDQIDDSDVPLDELGRLVTAWLDLRNRRPSAEQLAEQFQLIMGNKESLFPGVQWPQAERDKERQLGAFLDGTLQTSRPLRELVALMRALDARAEGVPQLLSEWLSTQKVPKTLLKSDLREFIPQYRPEAQEKGVGCKYFNARHRLNGLECSLVLVELARNETSINTISALAAAHTGEVGVSEIPQSPLHSHPGDEFILTLEGEICIHMGNTGMLTPLAKHDYVHFTAEVPHAALNLSNSSPAKILVIRFFQLDRAGTRQSQLTELGKLVDLVRQGRQLESRMRSIPTRPQSRWMGDVIAAGEYFKKSFEVLSQASLIALVRWIALEPWMRDRVRAPIEKLSSFTSRQPAQDMVGLSRFLQKQIVMGYPGERFAKPDVMIVRQKLQEFIRLKVDLETSESAQQGERLKSLVRLGAGDLEGSTEPSTHQKAEALYMAWQEVEVAWESYCRRFPVPERYQACLTGASNLTSQYPNSEDLEKLATELGIPPVLLFGFMAPAALRVVLVRGASAVDSAKESQFGDWVSVSDENSKAAGEGAVGARYWIPARSLNNSDISVTLLRLEASQQSSHRPQSDENFHPGFEMVVPLSGEVEVSQCDHTGKLLDLDSCGENEIVVYRSSLPHRLQARSSTATVLVIRFYVDDPSSAASNVE